MMIEQLKDRDIEARYLTGKPYKAHRLGTLMRRLRLTHKNQRHTKEQWQAILGHYGSQCLRCGSTERIAKDHVQALADGETDSALNLQPLCLSCNSGKNSNSVDYRPDRGYFAMMRWKGERTVSNNWTDMWYSYTQAE